MRRLPGWSVVVAAIPLICTFRSPAADAAQFTSPTAGYSVTYPDSWNAEPGDRDVFLFNYPPQEIPLGRTVPPGGASINIQTFPPYDNSTYPQGQDDYSALDALVFPGDAVLARTSPLSGQPARVTSVDNDLNTRFVHTVIHMGGKLFFFILQCNADDPQAAAYEQVLNGVIASISIACPTPAPNIPAPTAAAPTMSPPATAAPTTATP